MDKEYLKHEYKEIVLYLFIGIFFALIVPLGAGFIFGGFSESITSGLIHISDYLGTFLVYIFLIIASLFVVIFPISSLIFIKKGEHPATQSNPTWFRIFTVSWIFNPEDGALWQLSEALGMRGEKNFMKWSRSILRIFVVSTLMFGLLGIFQISNPSLNVVGVPVQELQQITVGSDIIFGSVIPAFSENGMFLIILFFLAGIIGYFTAKMKDKKTAKLIFFLVCFLLLAPLMGFFWMSFHNIVYGNSDASLHAAFMFGTIGTWITILTGTFVPWLMWHFFNNLFIKLLSAIAVTEDIVFISIVSWIALFLFWITIEFFLYRSKKRKGGG